MPNADERPATREGWGEGYVIGRLRELFATQLNIHVPSDDTDLLESGLLDSLGLVELLFHAERTFGLTIEVDELEVEHFRSLRAIGATIVSLGCATLGHVPPLAG